jgi:hypothetical protein
MAVLSNQDHTSTLIEGENVHPIGVLEHVKWRDLYPRCGDAVIRPKVDPAVAHNNAGALNRPFHHDRLSPDPEGFMPDHDGPRTLSVPATLLISHAQGWELIQRTGTRLGKDIQ